MSFTEKEIDIAINPNPNPTKLTNERMALSILELYDDFDTELRTLLEKTIIDYYLKKGN